MSGDRRARRDEPRALADALAEVGREIGMPAPDALTDVVRAWPEVVGTDLAAHARVRSVRDQVLTVEVDAPAFATELRYRDQELVAALDRHLGRHLVGRLRVVVAGPSTRP